MTQILRWTETQSTAIMKHWGRVGEKLIKVNLLQNKKEHGLNATSSPKCAESFWRSSKPWADILPLPCQVGMVMFMCIKDYNKCTILLLRVNGRRKKCILTHSSSSLGLWDALLCMPFANVRDTSSPKLPQAPKLQDRCNIQPPQEDSRCSDGYKMVCECPISVCSRICCIVVMLSRSRKVKIRSERG